MKINKIYNNKVFTASVLSFTFLLLMFSTACKKQLPGEGDIEDLTPPSAIFSYAQNDLVNYLEVSFINSSISSTEYAWDFGDGSTSTDSDPVHTYAADGTYTVTLDASNSFGGADSQTKTVIVSPGSGIAVAITNPSFVDEAVKNDNREAWRNTDLESDASTVLGIGTPVLQITTSARTGAWAGKLPTAENSGDPRRWLYQVITVAANTDYEISGWIRNKDANVGSTVTFEIYDAPFNDVANIGNASAILQSEDYNAASGHDVDVYTEATITFNSGASTEVVLFITNDYTINVTGENSETFLDDFSIVEL